MARDLNNYINKGYARLIMRSTFISTPAISTRMAKNLSEYSVVIYKDMQNNGCEKP